MKIAILGHNLRASGGAACGRGIVETLPQVAPMHEYLMIVPETWGYVPGDSDADIRTLECPDMPPWRRIFWERRTMRPAIDAFQPDWVWAIGNHGLKDGKWRQSLLMADARYVGYTWKYLGYRFADLTCNYPLFHVRKRSVRRSALCSRLVYLQTETMRRRFAEHFHFPMDRLGLCPNALTPEASASDRWPPAVEPHRGRFILLMLAKCFGHKNFDRVVDMFAQHREALKDAVCVVPLSKGESREADALFRRIARRGVEGSFVPVGTIPRHELGGYYLAADALLLPTTLESFSGTYIEAMRFGTPIVTSDLDFAHEVCGDAAVYVDPFSIDSIVEGVLKVRDDPGLRDTLIEKGRAQHQRYNRAWPDILRDVLDQETIEHLPP